MHMYIRARRRQSRVADKTQHFNLFGAALSLATREKQLLLCQSVSNLRAYK